jgi:thermitase
MNKIKLVIIVLLMSACIHADTLKTNSVISSGKSVASDNRTYIEGDVLVKFKKKTAYDNKIKIIASAGAEKEREFSSTGFMHIRTKGGRTTKELLSSLKNIPEIESVQPNFVYHTLSTTPSELSSGNQWALSNSGQTISSSSCGIYSTNNPGTSGCDINIKDAWDYISDCSDVIVAVVDTGVNYNHNDLKNNMWTDASGYYGYDFVKNTADPMDCNGHGTMVAGIIGAANDGSGCVGVYWKAKIMAIRVIDSIGTGSSANIVSGINYAVSNKAKVICLCIGGNSFDTAVYSALSNAKTNGVLVITGAGNDGVDINNSATSAHPEYDSFPAEYETGTYSTVYPALDNIISVAALDQSFNLASFSNYGNATVDIAAPGVNIYNTWAGTAEIIDDNFMNDDFSKTDWTGREDNTSFSVSNWGVRQAGSGYYLSNPSNESYYRNNSKDRAFKTYYFGEEATVSTLSCTLSYSLYDTSDSFNFYISNYNELDPLPATSSSLFSVSGGTGTVLFKKDITSYTSSQEFFSLLFYLSTSSSGTNTTGVKVKDLSLYTFKLDATSYYPKQGTSLSAAHVAGVAAMLLGFNSNYSYSDIADALKNGAKTYDSLTSSIKSGRVLDAAESFYYIAPPQNVTTQEL